MPDGALEGIAPLRRMTGIAVALTVAMPLSWTVGWYVAHGASVLHALESPWAAPRALVGWPNGADLDPRLIGSGAASLLAWTAIAAACLRPTPRPIHGDARFANRREIRTSKLRARSGVLLGRTSGLVPGYLRHGGPLHVLLVAPTRSGKGVGVVTPNLLSWPGSAVVLDVKNENFIATSGFRASHGSQVFRFAPGDPTMRTHRYNPLDAVRRERAHRVSDLQTIAHLLAPATPGETGMWYQEARSLFVGIALYILDTPGLLLTFGQVLRILQTDGDLGEALSAMIAKRGDSLDSACLGMLSSFANKAPKERSGVRSTLTGVLELYGDPLIDAATASSDFSFSGLRQRPMTVYVGVSLDQLGRLAPLLAIVFQQLTGMLSRNMPGSDEPYPVLALVDEFASLGRMDALVDAMPFLAGFNVRLLLVIQGLAQLDRLYGASGRELLLQNAGIQAFFATNDEQTSNFVSRRLGTSTVAQRTRSRSMPIMGGGGSVTRGTSYHPKPLMTPDEVRRMNRKRLVLFVEGGRPVLGHKIVYHADRRFAGRVQDPVAIEKIAVEMPPPFRFEDAVQAEPAIRQDPLPDLTAAEAREVLDVDRELPPAASQMSSPPPTKVSSDVRRKPRR